MAEDTSSASAGYSLRAAEQRHRPARYTDSPADNDPSVSTSTPASTADKAAPIVAAAASAARAGSPITPPRPIPSHPQASLSVKPTSAPASTYLRISSSSSPDPENKTPPSAQPPRAAPPPTTIPASPSSETSQPSSKPATPNHAPTKPATRPKARPLDNSQSTSKKRFQPDRDTDFFRRRAVTRDLEGTERSSEEEVIPSPPRAASSSSKKRSKSSIIIPPNPSIPSPFANSKGKAKEIPARAPADIPQEEDEADEPEEEPEEDFVDDSGDEYRDKNHTEDDDSSVIELGSGDEAAPSKATSSTKPTRKQPSTKPVKKAASKKIPVTPQPPKAKSKARSVSVSPTKSSPSKRRHEAVEISPEAALKRAVAAWQKAHREAEAKNIAKSKGKPYAGSSKSVSEAYLLFAKPELRPHPKKSGTQAVAFDCLCCAPPNTYTAFRLLNDSSTSLLSSHSTSKKSRQWLIDSYKSALDQDQKPEGDDISKFFVKATPYPAPQTIDTMDAMRARQISAAWVSEEARPMSIVGDKWFKEWLTPHRQSLVPDRRTVSDDVSEVHKAMQKHIIARLASIEGTIHLALDIWTSNNGHSFLGIIGCWQTEGSVQRHVLEMIAFPERHTAANIAKVVKQVVTRYQIQDRVWFIAADNASTNTTMMDILGKDQDLPRFTGRGSQVRCIAHVLNLISKAILRPFSKDIRAAKKDEPELDGDWVSDDEDLIEDSDVTEDEADNDKDTEAMEDENAAEDDDLAVSSSLHPSTTANAEDERLIRSAIEQHKNDWSTDAAPSSSPEDITASSGEVGLQIKQLAWFARKLRYNTRQRRSFQRTCSNYSLPKPYTLIRDVATRWNSTFDMIKRAVTLWDGIIAWQESNPHLIPAKFRLKRANQSGFTMLLHLLKPLTKATAKFSKKQSPTIGDVLGMFESLDSHYRKFETRSDIGEVWREAARRAGSVCAQYYGLADASDAYYLAVILHPNLRTTFMRAMKWEDSWIDKAVEVLRTTYEASYRMERDATQPEPQSSADKEDADTQEMDYMEEQLNRIAEAHKAETAPPDPVEEWISGYIAASGGKNLDPLAWWWAEHRRGNERLGLTRLALDVFSCPATSVDVERLFSKAGQHITPLRHRLKALKLQQLVTVGAWFREDWVPENLLKEYKAGKKAAKQKRTRTEGSNEAPAKKKPRVEGQETVMATE
ncbi:hypothetical protein A4X09_0g7388 [Tilletia walkeri]|uniref:HAT C-terminal dimerisation domain-containing protein n=1 Tax=Tilletia walkeri TaxID=117179 RepID=A0A8X7N208_9BASI|nr:hypothetical protein A4X09_0g7388 [Tilletia walkeri]